MLVFLFVFFKCATQKCRKILLDIDLTKCGELVVFHNQMLDRISSKPNELVKSRAISSMSLEELQKIDITENHPLG